MRVLVLLLAVVAWGCAGPLASGGLGTAEGYPGHTREDVLVRTAATAAAVFALAADGRITVETPEMSERATFGLRARFRDSLTVVLRGPLGIEGGRGLVTRDAALAVDRINRVVYVGDAGALGRVVPGGATVEAAARALAGLTVPETHLPWAMTAEGGLYRLAVALPEGGRREIDIDPRFWGVVALRVFDAGGALAGQSLATEHARVGGPGGAVLPRRVRLDVAGSRLTLEHRVLTVNPSAPLLRVAAPADYPIVPLDALFAR